MSNKQEMGLVKVEKGNTLALQGAGMATLITGTLVIPPEMTYFIGKDKSGTVRGGILASFWSLISREMGLQFTEPKILYHDENKIGISVGVKFWNMSGAVVEDYELVEIDSDKMYRESRLKWGPMKWTKNEDGYSKQVVDEDAMKEMQAKGYLLDEIDYDENMVPKGLKRKLPPEVEKEIYINFLTIKKNLLSKAITVAHRRLVQRACATNGVVLPEKDKKTGKYVNDITLQIYAFSHTGKKMQEVKMDGMQAEDDLTKDDMEPEKAEDASFNLEKQGKEQGENGEESNGKEKQDSNNESGKTAEEKFRCKSWGKPRPKRIFEYKGLNLCYTCQKA